jgi:hypothetical protein
MHFVALRVRRAAAGIIAGLALIGAAQSGRASQIIAWGAGQTNTGQYPQLGECIVPTNLTNAIAVSAGDAFSIALRADGTVTAWGDDSAGQTDVPWNATNVVAIAAGYAHALAVTSDGRVIGWGSDEFGQADAPSDLTNAVTVAAGQYHSLALRADGRVAAWGDDSLHQTDVPSFASNVIAVAAGRSHCVALRADGTVVCWGDGTSGQTSPPPGLKGVIAIAAGGSSSLAVRSDGTVAAWGSQTNVPFGLIIPAAEIISVNQGSTDTSTTKFSAESGNVVLNGLSGMLVVDGGSSGTILANGRANISPGSTLTPANSVSMNNWGTAMQMPDYTSIDFGRFIAVADHTPNGPSPSKNNHFTNISTFITAARNYTNPITQAMEGVIVLDVWDSDKNLNNLDAKDIPNGINVHGTLFFNFLGAGWDPVFAKIIVTTPLNINAADLSHLVATNPATYTSGYPPVYQYPTKNPVNIDISAYSYPNFANGDDLPALAYSTSVVDIHGSVNISGAVYTPSYMEIENKNTYQTQYVRGQLIGGYGMYLENISSSSISVFTRDPKPPPFLVVASPNQNLALRADGTLMGWGGTLSVPAGLTNVVSVAAGAWHGLALVPEGASSGSGASSPPNRSGNTFSVGVSTMAGHVYALEYKDSMAESSWKLLPRIAGTGRAAVLIDPVAVGPQRFYRIRRW